MGTRGVLGIRVEAKDKLTYNHFDSYPEGLGHKTIESLHDLLKDPQALRDKAIALTAIERGGKPTPEQVERLKPYTDLRVSGQSVEDWYCLLRKTHGDLKAILEAGLYEDSVDFAKDSLWCEWGYIANLSEEVLEIYRGFQKQPHTKGRFASGEASTTIGERSYYPIALIGTISFESILADKEAAVKDLLDLTREDEGEEDEAA